MDHVLQGNHVDRAILLGRSPIADVGRRVDDDLGVGQRGRQRLRLGEIAFDELDRQSVESPPVRIAAHHRLHLVAGLGRAPRKRAADHARSRR